MNRRAFLASTAAALATGVVGATVSPPKPSAPLQLDRNLDCHVLTVRDGHAELPLISLATTATIQFQGQPIKHFPDMMLDEDGLPYVLIPKNNPRSGVYVPLFEIAVNGPQSQEFLCAALIEDTLKRVRSLTQLGCRYILIIYRTPPTCVPNSAGTRRTVFSNQAIAGWISPPVLLC